MYEIWVSNREGMRRIARFRALSDALHFAERERLTRSVAIRDPEGAWYRDPRSGRAILERAPN